MSDLTQINKALSSLFPPTRMEVLTAGRKTGKNEWSIVVHPRGDGDLSSVLRLARTEGVPLRIGGRTINGRPPTTPGGAIRVDMTGMDRVISLDEESLLIRVQAGISIAVLKSRLSEKRLMTGWSIYSDSPHTLGAVLAGRVAARWGACFGPPEGSIRSLTAVLPDGGIVSSPPAPRRAAGPDLAALMVGTHGRLGVISELTLRVYPWPEHWEAISMEFQVEQLRTLGAFLRRGYLPNLMEVDVQPDGNVQCVVALSGMKSNVVTIRTEMVEQFGGSWEVEPGLPPRTPPLANSVVLSWGGLSRFLDVWTGLKTRSAFQLYECTGTSVKLSGGNPKAIRAALEATSELRRHPKDRAREHLGGVKNLLDSPNILGPMEGRDPIC